MQDQPWALWDDGQTQQFPQARPPRRAWVPWLFIGVIVAAIAGAGVGLLLTRDRGSSAQPAASTSPRPSQSGSAGATAGPDSSVEPTPTGPTGEACPVEAERAVGVGPLRRVVRYRTDASTVTICQADDGTLYYHGMRNTTGNTITLLARREGAGYSASNNREGGAPYVYRVDDTHLVITRGAQVLADEPVTGVDRP